MSRDWDCCDCCGETFVELTRVDEFWLCHWCYLDAEPPWLHSAVVREQQRDRRDAEQAG